MKEKYSYYEYEIIKFDAELEGVKQPGFKFEIQGAHCLPYDDGIIESDEWYDTAQEARFAAIGYIDFLENGGYSCD